LIDFWEGAESHIYDKFVHPSKTSIIANNEDRFCCGTGLRENFMCVVTDSDAVVEQSWGQLDVLSQMLSRVVDGSFCFFTST
jgi:hypothetical protein